MMENEAISWAQVALKMVDKTDWTTVLVGLVSGIAGFLGNYWLTWKQGRGEVASIRAALVAEVAALVEIEEVREYELHMRQMSYFLRTHADVLHDYEPETFQFRISIAEHYNRVYQQHVATLGRLSPIESREFVRFYQFVDSFRADVSENGVLYEGSRDHQVWGETAEILASALDVGRRLASTQSPWWKRLLQHRKVIDANQVRVDSPPGHARSVRRRDDERSA
ncbi:TPA: hypothetical protein NNM78_005344 [Pseudomonas aeruginosa]|uniref:hypothetical protein n=2 Tax=Pseudomonas aeruginosa TaxID=287 RepID=UPI000F543F66|nr:hypothetical protein [Pseudomonas aeruginosa]MCO3003440.1 hypothetical protein [Pseudomonas aeruginosa]RQA21187.1 hypothetical protein IPC508_01105 [Pseudomonas aeruginosa]HCH7785863.1 hypothetical protein [Pseudomonas aeruginosa]